MKHWKPHGLPTVCRWSAGNKLCAYNFHSKSSSKATTLQLRSAWHPIIEHVVLFPAKSVTLKYAWISSWCHMECEILEYCTPFALRKFQKFLLGYDKPAKGETENNFRNFWGIEPFLVETVNVINAKKMKDGGDRPVTGLYSFFDAYSVFLVNLETLDGLSNAICTHRGNKVIIDPDAAIYINLTESTHDVWVRDDCEWSNTFEFRLLRLKETKKVTKRSDGHGNGSVRLRRQHEHQPELSFTIRCWNCSLLWCLKLHHPV